MTSTPVDGHSQEFEQLAGLSALDVLEGEELERFQLHAASCERCQLMVRLDRQSLDTLLLTAPEMDPSPDFKARVMRRAADELASRSTMTVPPPATPILPRPRPSNVVPLWRRSPWARALAAVFVAAVVTVGAFGYENQVVATYELSGSLSGNARVLIRRSGAALLEMQDVPDPGTGFMYEAWVIPEGQQPIPVDTLARGTGTLNLPGGLEGSTVAITRERTRVDVPTPPVLMATRVLRS